MGLFDAFSRSKPVAPARPAPHYHEPVTDITESVLSALKQRAKIGGTLTLVGVFLQGTTTRMPDPRDGIPGIIRRIHEDSLELAPYGINEGRLASWHWPLVRQDGFLGMIGSPHGYLTAVLSDTDFVVDCMITFEVYRIGSA